MVEVEYKPFIDASEIHHPGAIALCGRSTELESLWTTASDCVRLRERTSQDIQSSRKCCDALKRGTTYFQGVAVLAIARLVIAMVIVRTTTDTRGRAMAA
jgi:hypothetical protein